MYAKHIIILLLSLLMATHAAEARRGEVQKLYIFGMAASFTDTIVHFTPIQELDSAWTDKKRGFLLGREEYSYQLRDYLGTALLMPFRTCIVIYDSSRKKIEKKFARMMRLYSSPAKNERRYDVRHIDGNDFRFRPVDMSAEEQPEEETAAAGHAKKEKDKNGKKGKGGSHKPEAGKGRRAPRG